MSAFAVLRWCEQLASSGIIFKPKTIGHPSRDGVYILQCTSYLDTDGIITRVT